MKQFGAIENERFRLSFVWVCTAIRDLESGTQDADRVADFRRHQNGRLIANHR
jgi:hypothetical protein